MNFENAYNNQVRAESYSRLEFPNTYYLAYRDLPVIIKTHTKGKKAVDFGCGTGRSTRFLSNLGFDTIGIDISQSMIDKAFEAEPTGDYRLVSDENYKHLGNNMYDLVLSVFTFDNIPGFDRRTRIIRGLSELLKKSGTMILLDSTEDLYRNEWASFSTHIFPENQKAGSGSIVKVLMNDVEDKRPVEDVLWTEEDYKENFRLAGLKLEQIYKPLGREDEPYEWKMEREIAPWAIYVVKKDEMFHAN